MSRQVAWLALSSVVFGWVALAGLRPGSAPKANAGSAAATVLEGKTQPARDRAAVIAPQTTQPVREVRVAAGEHVKKDQILIQLDDDEDRAAVRAKEAALEAAVAKFTGLRLSIQNEKDQATAHLKATQAEAKDEKKSLDRIEVLYRQGSVAEKTYREARTELVKALENERVASDKLQIASGEQTQRKVDEAQAAVRQAQAELDKAKADLDNQTLRARVAGTVSWLSARPGMVGRPGLATWGEIIDTTALEVRCDVAPEQASAVRVGQAAQVAELGPGTAELRGKVSSVGAIADPKTGLLPVIVHVDNPDGHLRVHVPVRVTLMNGDR